MKHLGYSRVIKARDLRVLARYTAVGACIKPRMQEKDHCHTYFGQTLNQLKPVA